MKLALAVLLLVVLIAPSLALAQIRYKDAEGVMHFVDSIDQVPEQYRAGAVGRPVPPAPRADSIQGSPAPPPADGPRLPPLPGIYSPAVPNDLGRPAK